jgi:hypothetical protein
VRETCILERQVLDESKPLFQVDEVTGRNAAQAVRRFVIDDLR